MAESVSVDVELPPKSQSQRVAFVLSGEGELGDVDIVATLYSFQDDQGEEDGEEEEECCGGDCDCCDHKCADKEEKKEDVVVKTL